MAATQANKRVCIDVGGTFTDFLVIEETGLLAKFKASTTPSDPTQGFMDAMGKAARHYGVSVDQFLGQIDVLVHGTTLATNIMLTGRGAKVGMLTTRNFRDRLEIRLPWRLLKYEFATDFSGAGRWRGGPGVDWEAQNEGSAGQMATGSSEGDVVQGSGAAGGLPSPVCRTCLRRGGEDIPVKPHRMFELKERDILVKHSSGGGGVGNPAERDPEMVRQDLENELVSLSAAKEIYKVVIDPVSLRLDMDATNALRGRW